MTMRDEGSDGADGDHTITAGVSNDVACTTFSEHSEWGYQTAGPSVMNGDQALRVL